MDERRLFLFLILAFVVVTVYPMLFPPPARQQQQPVAASPTPMEPPAAAAQAEPARQTPKGKTGAAVVAAVADTAERRVEVRTREASIVFTNRGARLLSWGLDRFKDERGRANEMVAVVPNAVRALDVETGDAQIDGILREALYRVSSESVDVSSGEEATLTFEYAGNDLVVRKEILFRGQQPLADVSVSVQRGGRELNKRLLWGPGIGIPTDAERAVRGYLPAAAVALVNGTVERLPSDKLKEGRRSLSNARWVGVESRYFVALLEGSRTGVQAAEALAVDVPLPAAGGNETRAVTAFVLGDRTGPVTLYVGAKDYFQLAPLGHDFKAVVPVGDWIGPIVIPLMRLMRWVHGYVGNYGWSIVLLTVLINLVMGPFRHFSIVNGIKMAKLAPEMRVIQERYKKIPLLDARRQPMQEEMGALYARHGLSMSTQMTVGCLPLLLTMPFFFAFYRVLDISIELRGAPYLWIPDLSQKDPYYLAPILMAVSMFILQRLTPAAVDPAQQRMMMLMPVLFVVFLFAAPAGLNLYWLASNCCSVTQQGVTMRLLKGHTKDAKRGGHKR
jgi:YidC/Oxa1 family membrane protein insertase